MLISFRFVKNMSVLEDVSIKYFHICYMDERAISQLMMIINKGNLVLSILFVFFASVSMALFYMGAGTGFLAVALISPAVVILALFYIRHKSPLSPLKRIKKMMAPYRDLIVETSTEPSQTPTTIELETLEDLAKVSQILARPILHLTQDRSHTFYIVENDMRYKFNIVAIPNPEPRALGFFGEHQVRLKDV